MQQLTVTTLLRYLKNKLDTDNNIQRVLVSGEISNFHNHYSGHLYFTLKDDKAAINCVMFKSMAANLKFMPKNGDKVIISANTSIFETTGQLQLYILKISLDGIGDLYTQYEALKFKLSQEGYFDDFHKKKLSKTYIERVCVLVGDKSAAMSDIKIAFNRRWPLTKVDYYPVLVQGNLAAQSIIDKLIEVDELNYDVIILARGGGSFEDLFCFNDERLVITIYNLKTFIISGIGHEQDFTLVDFVSDLRAATPTACVELITPDISDVYQTINAYENDLNTLINLKLNKVKMNYDYHVQKLYNYQSHINDINNDIDNRINLLNNIMINKVNNINNNLQLSIFKIDNVIKLILERNKLTLKRLTTLLEAYSTSNVLKRGYTLIVQDNIVVKSKNELLDKEFDIKFVDGDIRARKV